MFYLPITWQVSTNPNYEHPKNQRKKFKMYSIIFRGPVIMQLFLTSLSSNLYLPQSKHLTVCLCARDLIVLTAARFALGRQGSNVGRCSCAVVVLLLVVAATVHASELSSVSCRQCWRLEYRSISRKIIEARSTCRHERAQCGETYVFFRVVKAYFILIPHTILQIYRDIFLEI